MLNLNSDNFKSEVIESKTPVLVDFYATSCGPCRRLEPILKDMEGKVAEVKFAKVEANDAMDVFGEYKVSRVPTMIIFKDGKAVDSKAGLMSEKDISDWIQEKTK